MINYLIITAYNYANDGNNYALKRKNFIFDLNEFQELSFKC